MVISLTEPETHDGQHQKVDTETDGKLLELAVEPRTGTCGVLGSTVLGGEGRGCGVECYRW